MPATKKVSTQLLVSPHVRDRARALAVVRNESVAEVNRIALEGKGLSGLERQHADDLAVLNATISKLNLNRSEALAYMLTYKVPVTELHAKLSDMRERMPAL